MENGGIEKVGNELMKIHLKIYQRNKKKVRKTIYIYILSSFGKQQRSEMEKIHAQFPTLEIPKKKMTNKYTHVHHTHCTHKCTHTHTVILCNI